MRGGALQRNGRILAATVGGFLSGIASRPQEFRQHVVRDAWTMAKRFGDRGVENIEARDVPFLYDQVVESYIDDPQRAVIAALVRGLGSRTFFEIGTHRGRTTWTVARHNPDVGIYTLDLQAGSAVPATAFELAADDRSYLRPETLCGEAFRETPEAARIEQLWGDSATFDFSPYAGRIDFVYIDGAHTYEYVNSDTGNALRMLSPTGTIAWDDYATGPGVYRAMLEIAPTLPGAVYHLRGLRMALFSRQAFVRRHPNDRFPFS
jgi:predicted O-methyltransferase YrrM